MRMRPSISQSLIGRTWPSLRLPPTLRPSHNGSSRHSPEYLQVVEPTWPKSSLTHSGTPVLTISAPPLPPHTLKLRPAEHSPSPVSRFSKSYGGLINRDHLEKRELRFLPELPVGTLIWSSCSSGT